MAVEQDLGAQAALSNQINATLEQRVKKLEEINAHLSEQLKISREISGAMGNVGTSASGSLGQASKAAEEAANAQGKVNQKSLEYQKIQEKMKGNVKGITTAFGSWFGTLKNIATAIGGVAGSLLDFAKVLISVPFDIFDAFIEKANSLPYSTAIFEALQEIKKAFGDLASGPGKAVKDNLAEIRSNMRNLVGTGLTVHSVFGYGPEGVAAALKSVNELAVNLGAGFYNLTEVIRRHGLESVVMAKGLGLSNEQMAQQMKFAQAMGKDPVKAQDEFASAAIRTAKAFGMAHKVIARGMNDLLQQFPNLAKQGPKALAPIVAYAQKLGIEIKDLTGVMDKFSSFEGAADATSQLSQAFGVNIDAMRLMAAESPAEKLEMLRKGFQAAGVNADHMSFAQRKLAKELTGTNDAMFDQAFGLGNQKVKLEDTEKQAQKAMKVQMEHTKIMKELGKAIEKIAPPEGKKFKSFFDSLTEGFSDGIFYTSEMRHAMWNLRASMREFYWMGREIGTYFVKYFPGVKDMLGGIAKIFDPANFRRLKTEVMPIIKEFFTDLDFGKLFNKLITAIDRTIGGGASAGIRAFQEGFKKFVAALGKVAGGALETVLDLMKKGVEGITNIIKNPQAFLASAGQAAQGAKTIADSFFGPLGEAFAKAGPPLWEAIKGMLETIWEKIKKWWDEPETGGKDSLIKFFKAHWKDILIFSAMLNPAATLQLAASIGGLLINAGRMGMLMASKGGPGATQAGAAAGQGMMMGLLNGFGKGVEGAAMGVMGTRAFQKLPMGMQNRLMTTLPGMGGQMGQAVRGMAGAAIAVGLVKGVADGLNFDTNTEQARMTGQTKFGAGVFSALNAMTFGAVDLQGKLDAEATKIREKAAENSMKQTVVENQRAVAELDMYEDRLQKSLEKAAKDRDAVIQTVGGKALTAIEDAEGDYAELQVQKAIAEGRLKYGDKDYEEQKNRLKQLSREYFKRNSEKIVTELKNAELDKEEAKKLAKIEKAKTLVERIKDIGTLKVELDKGLDSLNKALAGGEFETKIKKVVGIINSVYPQIEQAMLKIQNSRTASIGKFEDESDPVATLSKIVGSMGALADNVQKVSKKIDVAMLTNLNNLLVVMFGPPGKTATKSILSQYLSAVNHLEGVDLNDGLVKNFADAFESISKVSSNVAKTPVINDALRESTKATLSNMGDIIGWIGQVEGFKSELNSMVLADALSASTSILGAAKNFKEASSIMNDKTVTTISKYLTKITDVGTQVDSTKVLAVASSLGKLAENVVTAGGFFKAPAEAVTAFNAMKSGKINVKHNIPGVKMEVNVNLEAKQLVKEIVVVDITTTPETQKYIALSNSKANIDETSSLTVVE